jgi:LacI family transcriptional regulator
MADSQNGRKLPAKPTIGDVAREAEVSRSTAARTLGGYGYVSEPVRESVQAAAIKLGYRANAAAKTLKYGRSRSIGVIVSDISDLFFAEVVQGITEVVRREGYDIVIVNTDDDLNVEINAVNLLLEKRVDGVIVSSSAIAPSQTKHLNEVQEVGTPLVLIDRLVQGIDSDAIVVDNRAAARAATNVLLASGHRRIAILWGPPDGSRSVPKQPSITAGDGVWSSGNRYRGYLDALEAADVAFDPSLVGAGPHTSFDGAAQVMKMLSMSDPPTAIIATEKEALIGVLRALKLSGRECPRDLSVVGFDDNPWLEVLTPSLTMIEQPTQEIGRRAAQRVIDRIEGSHSGPNVVTLTARLIERSSVLPRVSD